MDVSPEAWVAFRFGLVAVEQSAIREQLNVVDGEPFGRPELPVEWIQRHPVRRHVATTVAVHPVRTDQRRCDHRRCAGLHGDGRHGLGHRRGKQWGLRIRYRNPDRVHQLCGNRGALVEHDVQPHRRGLGRPEFRCRCVVSEDSRPVGEPVTGQAQQSGIGGTHVQ